MPRQNLPPETWCPVKNLPLKYLKPGPAHRTYLYQGVPPRNQLVIHADTCMHGEEQELNSLFEKEA